VAAPSPVGQDEEEDEDEEEDGGDDDDGDDSAGSGGEEEEEEEYVPTPSPEHPNPAAKRRDEAAPAGTEPA